MGIHDTAEMYERRELTSQQFKAVRTALLDYKDVMLAPYGKKGQSYILAGRQPLPSDIDARADEVGRRLVGYLETNLVKFYPRFNSEVVDNLAIVIDKALGAISPTR